MEAPNSTQNFLNADIHNDEIDLGKLFRFLMMQSKLILSIVFVVFTISFTYYSFATKKYEITSLIQYEAFDQNIFDPTQVLQFASSGNSSSDISNMITLYESRTNYIKVIEDLKLNIKVEGLDNNEALEIEIISFQDSLLGSNELNFSISENSYTLLDNDLNEIQTSKYGEQIVFNQLNITIKSVSVKEYRPLKIHFRSPESMYNELKSAIEVNTELSRNSFFKKEGLITVSYVTDDIDLGKTIIDYANNVFLNQRIYDENEKSRKAINFIEDNLKTIEQSVETSKAKLKQFREQNKSIDVGLEIEAIINKIQTLDTALASIDIEITKAKEIYTPNNPAYLNLISKKNLIELQKEQVLTEVEMMPKEQQEFIDLFNDLEVSQALYEELESRRLGFSILEASTIGDIRVIDEAYVESLVSPRILVVLLSSILAFIFACVTAIIRGLYFLPISNPAEFFDNNVHIPIIGVIPQVDDIEDENDVKLSSSLESLVVNINSIKSNNLDKKIITITSPSAGNGKSTISRKLGESMTKIGKKVLLIDNDLKRGHLAKDFGIKSISENTFLSIDESSIEKYRLDIGLYLIPRVKGLNNTFQFLYSNYYSEKIEFFKKHFDFIIFDTGPILAVADSSVLVEKSDFNILVTRHGVTKINEVKQCQDNFRQINKNIDGLIYNAYAKPQSYYGYYGLYGNYAYQYYADKYLDDTYEYENKV